MTQGKQGDTGSQGLEGKQGDTGSQGLQGEEGKQGSTGVVSLYVRARAATSPLAAATAAAMHRSKDLKQS